MVKSHSTGGGANRNPAEIEKLKRKYDEFDAAYIVEIFKDVFDLEVESIEKPMNIGIPHVTYIVKCTNGKEFVYRGNLGTDEPETELLKEKLAADIARINHIPSNEIIYIDASRKQYPFDFQIQKKFGGLDAEIQWTGNESDYLKYSFNIGQVIAKLSEIKLQGEGHFAKEKVLKGEILGESKFFYEYIELELETQLEEIEKVGYINGKTHAAISKIFTDSRRFTESHEGCLVHYDLSDHNLRYNPRTFTVEAVYDWEACVVGDPVLDIASAPTWKSVYPKEKAIIEGFLSLVNKPDYFQEKIDLYRLRTIIWKSVHNIKFDLVTKDRLARLQTALDPYKLKMESII